MSRRHVVRNEYKDKMKLRQEKFIVYEATVMLLLNIKKNIYIYIYIKEDVFKNFLDGVSFLIHTPLCSSTTLCCDCEVSEMRRWG